MELAKLLGDHKTFSQRQSIMNLISVSYGSITDVPKYCIKRRQAKLQWLQNRRKINGDHLDKDAKLADISRTKEVIIEISK